MSFPERGESYDTADPCSMSVAFTVTTVLPSTTHTIISILRDEENRDLSSAISPAELSISARPNASNGYSHVVGDISQRGPMSGVPVPNRRFP